MLFFTFVVILGLLRLRMDHRRHVPMNQHCRARLTSPKLIEEVKRVVAGLSLMASMLILVRDSIHETALAGSLILHVLLLELCI